MKNGAEQKQALEAIRLLLSGRLNSQSSIGPETVKAYLMAVSKGTLEGLLKACEAFSEGRVEGFNNDYAPTAARLAEEARKWDDAIASLAEVRSSRERLIPYAIGAKPPPPAVPLGPTAIDHGGRMVDLSKMSPAEKDAIIDGKPLPKPKALPHERKVPMPKLRRTDE